MTPAPADGALDTGAAPGLQGSPSFEVLGIEPKPAAAAPTLVLSLAATVADPREVYTIALTAEVQIEAARRAHDEETRSRLVDLFGAPERWPTTIGNVWWARLTTLVPSFNGTSTFELTLPCTYDLEVAATKYVYALPGGEVPLALHFTGTVFYAGDDGRLQLEQVPWSCSARYELPVEVWRRLMAQHYGSTGWIRLHDDTLGRLRQRAAERGSPSLDVCVAELLDEAGR